MAGNSKRRGAVRKAGTKKGAQVGSGGQGRKSLRGKGPTPKAEDRPYHPAAKRKASAERSAPRRSRPAGDRPYEVIGGRNSVLEALRADVPASTVYVATGVGGDERTAEIRRIIADRGIPLLEVTRTELDRLTDGGVHQGVGLQVPTYTYAEPADLLSTDAPGAPLIVALDSVTDPRNLGAALRSAGAFGAHGVLIPQRRSAGLTASAWKVSAGAAARVPVARATNLVRALGEYKKAGCFVVGLDGEAQTPVAELPLVHEPLVLVLGSEGKGLGRLVRETCDALVSIPISASMESLNAGTAIGIALYEVARQRSEG
ncbi:23S rRNA (guanosine(2251)-2'-O)-methyltransferase RlmB [Pseudactinotalea sp. Z1748]|uniref:23S rRNA (guanosine(2251)-2'-O)-methyltransferase RlmB n=1 Tax=Pseudactinotalea sp. Z1748 TaxID=3413027 RepID=UPI003C7A9623